MTAAALLAAIAACLLLAAAREIVAARGAAREPPWLGYDAHRRLTRAALELGLPARLARSGFSSRVPLAAVLIAKLGTAALGGMAAWLAAPAAPGRTSMLIAIVMPVAGFLAPDALLERAARLRRRRLLEALPNALDLLAVGSASGRSAATGFAEIARAGRGPLADELRVTVAEITGGVPLTAALRSLRERVPGSELATLCAAVERSRRFGSPLAEQLRRQAAGLRRDQRRAVEERASRAAPKIQLVVALVLVPSVLLMIAAGLIANADLLLGSF